MQRTLVLFLLSAALVWGVDSWSKVHDLKSGAELRIFKKGVKQPVLATYEDLNDESLIIATKKEQLAIRRDQIERIDARPMSEGRVTKETRTTETGPDASRPPLERSQTGPTTSSSTNFSFGSKPDFQTIYRATAAGSGR